jgi:hypothetical protein
VPVDVFPVKDKTGAAVAGRTVRAYREDTGALIGSATTTEELSEQVGDEHWASVVLTMHMDGVDGSTTFTDETGKTVTAYGDAQVDTAQSKFGGASLVLDGTGDYIEASAASTDFAFGTGDFTVEFWARKPANGQGGYDSAICTASGGSVVGGWLVELSSSRGFVWNIGGPVLSYSTNPNDSTWHHWAVCRSGTTLKLFMDGVAVASTTNSTNIVANYALRVGSCPGTSYSFNGYIDDLRITKGVARYTANFTPPAAAFLGANLPPTPLGGYKIDTGAHSGPCTLVFSGEPDRNALVLSGVTPV